LYTYPYYGVIFSRRRGEEDLGDGAEEFLGQMLLAIGLLVVVRQDVASIPP